MPDKPTISGGTQQSPTSSKRSFVSMLPTLIALFGPALVQLVNSLASRKSRKGQTGKSQT